MITLSNNVEMPKLIMGTYLLKGKQLIDAVDKALSIGYRGFDTARYYENEQDLGDALSVLLPRHNLRHDEIFIITKVFPSNAEASQQDVYSEIMTSINLLKRQYLDLVLVHYPRPLNTKDDDVLNKTYRKAAWLALEQMLKYKNARAIGVSNYEPRHLEEMKEYSIPAVPHVNQVEYHPHFQRGELRQYCQSNGIHFQAFSPLGRGSQILLSDTTLKSIAEAHKTTVPTVILAWIMKGNNSVVVKSATPERIEENFKALDLNLTDKEYADISSCDLSTPHVEDDGWNVV
uniref:Aldo_ket_red domain-containing protein n=1 Tax=Caenorhabditis tropicalis TaxID=1561998 RepID=A0A1I7UNS7_9PELO